MKTHAIISTTRLEEHVGIIFLYSSDDDSNDA